jgi:hypothetical protein
MAWSLLWSRRHSGCALWSQLPTKLCVCCSGSSHSTPPLEHYHFAFTCSILFYILRVAVHAVHTDHRHLEHSLQLTPRCCDRDATVGQAPHHARLLLSCPRHARHGPDAHPP